MKIQGKTLVRQSLDYTWTPTDGYTFTPVDVGLSASVAGLARTYRYLRIPHRVRHDGPVSAIEAEHQLPDNGQAETPAGSWALIGQQESVDWRQHSSFLALTEDEQWTINRVISREITDEPADYVWVDITPSAFTPSSEALFFYKLAFNGQQYFTRTNYVLRHTMTVSQVYESQLSGSNINRVFSKTQLLAEAASFDDPLPQLLINEINAIPALNTTVPTGYVEGWLKQSPTIQTVAGGRVECSVEYVYETWPTIFYPAKP